MAGGTALILLFFPLLALLGKLDEVSPGFSDQLFHLAGNALDIFTEILHHISALPVFNFIDGILGHSFS